MINARGSGAVVSLDNPTSGTIAGCQAPRRVICLEIADCSCESAPQHRDLLRSEALLCREVRTSLMCTSKPGLSALSAWVFKVSDWDSFARGRGVSTWQCNGKGGVRLANLGLMPPQSAGPISRRLERQSNQVWTSSGVASVGYVGPGDDSRVFEEEEGEGLFNVGAFPIQEGRRRQPSSRTAAIDCGATSNQ
jgi:hypothetical protein